MSEFKQIYKCESCGNVVEIIHKGRGNLMCCGNRMTLLDENADDGEAEEHVPIMEKLQDGGVYVKVGETEHPMEEDHYIEWIGVQTPNKVYRKYLKPQDKPEAIFKLNEEVLFAREYCNVHGLWKK